MSFVTSGGSTKTIVTNNFDTINSTGYYRHLAGDYAVGAPTNTDDLILEHQEFDDDPEVTGANLVAKQTVYYTSSFYWQWRIRRANGSWDDWNIGTSRAATDDRHGQYVLAHLDTNADSGNSVVVPLKGLNSAYGHIDYSENNAGITCAFVQNDSKDYLVTYTGYITQLGSGNVPTSYFSERSTSAGNRVGMFAHVENGEEAYGRLKVSRENNFPLIYDIILTCNYNYRYHLLVKRLR